MLGWLTRKILTSVLPTLFGATLLAFFLLRMVPGDPVLNLLGERGANPEVIAQMRERLGLDKSLLEQYGIFLKQAVQGDFGQSIISKQPVISEFAARMPATLELSLMALIWTVVLGIPLGILAAHMRGVIDLIVVGVSLIGSSLPIFWWGLVLILYVSVQLSLLPVSGRIAVEYDIPTWTGFLLIDAWKSSDGFDAFWSALKHLILPSIVLGTVNLALLLRMVRSGVLEAMDEDFVRLARAKGAGSWRVLWVHALRSAWVPVVTVLGLMVGTLLTGAVITETIFSWPGVGKWIVKSLEARDYPVIQGGILLFATIMLMVNLLVDVIYLWVDPRMRKGMSS